MGFWAAEIFFGVRRALAGRALAGLKTFKTRATRSFVNSQSRKKESLDEDLVHCRLCLRRRCSFPTRLFRRALQGDVNQSTEFPEIQDRFDDDCLEACF